MYEKIANRATPAADGYVFDLSVHIGVYAKSSYYVGASMWNSRPVNIRNLNNKKLLKRKIRDCLN